MQNSRVPVVILIFSVLLLCGGLYFYLQSKHRYNWSDSAWSKDSYSEKNGEPYGAEVFRNVLKGYFSNQSFKELTNLPEGLPDSTHTGENYVFIGAGMYLDSLSKLRLLSFVRAGNTALIISKSLPAELMHEVYDSGACDLEWVSLREHTDSMARLSLRSPDPDSSYNAFYAFKNKPETYDWHFISSDLFCEGSPNYPLGYLNKEYINFAKFPYGKGAFLLHSNPLVFSNFSLTREEPRRYVAAVLSHLPEGSCYWDAVSRVPEEISRRRNGDEASESPHLLAFILQKPALAWAWYLLVAMTLLWLFFRAKRRYKAIPVLPQKENSSYEFINIIAHLHFKSGDFRGLSIQMMKLFFVSIRERYNLTFSLDHANAQLKEDEQTIQQLVLVSGVPEQQVRQLINQYKDVSHYGTTEKMAIELHQRIELFWKTAR